MGNVKVYTFRCGLHLGEALPSHAGLIEAARSSSVVVSMHDDGAGQLSMMGIVESSSQVADNVIDLVRSRYPSRWCVITRFDVDWSDFRVMSWEDGQESPDVFVADNWRKVTL